MSKKRIIKAKTQRSLARQLGRSEGAVRKWIARDDWPFRPIGPWDVERVRAWMEIQLKPDAAAAYHKKSAAAESGTGEFAGIGPLTKARIQATIERALLVRQRRLIEAGEFHNIKECLVRRSAQIKELRDRLLEIPRTVMPKLAPQSSQATDAIERILTETIRSIINAFAGVGDDAKEPNGR